MDDIIALRESGKLEGVVVGRALYDGVITPAELLA
jgi:phosphoribosylformimino-5-aminoimidazole carboxamide ribonucleotide (ProFAR) isomerase